MWANYNGHVWDQGRIAELAEEASRYCQGVGVTTGKASHLATSSMALGSCAESCQVTTLCSWGGRSTSTRSRSTWRRG